MTNIKKKLSVDLLKVINRALSEHPGLVKPKPNDKDDLYLIDNDNNSNFFFAVTKESVGNDGQLYIEYGCKPFSNVHKEFGGHKKKLAEFENSFKEWLNNLEVYKERSPMDDLILIGYADEFLNDFKILDADAEEKAFGFSQQLRLNAYLQTIVEKIDCVKTQENAELIEEIKTESASLQADITNETKSSTMGRLSKIWAKARKAGLKAGEFMVKEFAKEFLKEGAKALFNFAATNANKLPDYIGHLVQDNNHLLS